MPRPQNRVTESSLIGALGLISILGGCNTSKLTKAPFLPKPETPETPVEQASGTKKTYRLGEAFGIRDEVTDAVISFTNTRKSQGEEFLKPKEGHYWFYVTGTIANKSANEFVISPDFYTITDSNKKTYPPSIRAHALEGVKVLQGRIPPQSEKKAEIGFELPKGTQPTLLSFDISNYTACNDSSLKSSFFCQSISIKVSDKQG